jgi:glycosyltransferase involved in cell wall biosynthesis
MSYLPGLWRLTRAAWATPADVVIVEAVPLFVGLAHKLRWKSLVILDAHERLGGIRSSGSLAAWYSRVESTVLRLTQRHIDGCITVCSSHAREYESAGLRHVMVLRNVTAAPPHAQFEPPIFDGEFKMAYVGSLYAGRGLEPLIKAVALCRQQGADVALDITGWGSPEYLGYIRRLIESSGVQRSVRLCGPCTHEEVARRYGLAHLACVLYEQTDAANDSLPNKLFEALAAGRPVLAGNQPEIRRIVEHYQCGKVSAVTAPALAGTILQICHDPTQIREMAFNAHNAFVHDLNWSVEEMPFREAIRMAGASAGL